MKKIIILVMALFMILLLNNLTHAQQWEYYPRNNNYQYNSWNRSQQYSPPRFSSPYQQNYSQQRPSGNSFDPYYFRRRQFEQKMQETEELRKKSRQRMQDYIFYRSLLK